ncbi:MAG TPA: hypothetical protein VLH84_00510 [Patescibacteria group bacterium]|nr:hypothetical protein [Patescibacteria group bacterium]
MSYENSGNRIGFSGITVLLVGIASFAIGGDFGKWGADTDAKVERGQLYNEELTSQLTPGRVVSHMLVDLDANTVTFQSQDQTGMAETCTGKYQVHNDIAALVGQLSCTQAEPLPASS